MTDVFTVEKRSEIMRAVKSRKNKSTELKIINIFKLYGIKGWRRNYKIIGNPDFVFSKKKLAIFVDGCFWHGHSCRNVKPQNNAKYWEEKIKRNEDRDKIITNQLQKKGWKIIRIWECELKDNKKIEILKECLI